MDHSKISHKPNFFDPKFADCKFLVGTTDDKEEIVAHKIILAKASPVFTNMFYGAVPEQGETVEIPDIQPEAFRNMVEFIYGGEVKITSVEHAVQVFYTAEKYDIEALRKYTTDYLIINIKPTNVIYILNFAISFNNQTLINKCNEIIVTETSILLNHTSFLEADVTTWNFIFDQDKLNISEIDLFKALVRYDATRKNIDDVKSVQKSCTSTNSQSGDITKNEASVPDGNFDIASDKGLSNQNCTETQRDGKLNGSNPVKELVKKIRFLAMTSDEFQECAKMSSLLSTSEANNILLNMLAPAYMPTMPEGFSKIKEKRKQEGNLVNYWLSIPSGSGLTIEKMISVPIKNIDSEWSCTIEYQKYYYEHAIEKTGSYLNLSGILRGSLNVKPDRDCVLTGVQLNIPTSGSDNFAMDVEIQVRDYLSRDLMSKTESLSVPRDCFVTIAFNCPMFLGYEENHEINVTFQNSGKYNRYKCVPQCRLNDISVKFLRATQLPCDCNGLIRSLIISKVGRKRK